MADTFSFDWDEANIGHIARHGVTPEDAEYALTRHTAEVEYQDWHEEERFAEVGCTPAGRIIVIVTTLREAKVRVVTVFDASRTLVEEYLASR